MNRNFDLIMVETLAELKKANLQHLYDTHSKDGNLLASPAATKQNIPGLASTHTPIIPEIPPYVDIEKNILMAEANVDPFWFYGMVDDKGPWDYKYINSLRYENFGNFHYGVVAAAFGWPTEVILRMAGYADWRNESRRSPEKGNPLGDPPYGDEFKDQYWIKQGIEYYNKYYKNRPDKWKNILFYWPIIEKK